MALLKKDEAFVDAALEDSSLEKVSTGISQVALGLIMSLAGLTGIWGIACLISGIAKSGGLLELARGWLTAIGM